MPATSTLHPAVSALSTAGPSTPEDAIPHWVIGDTLDHLPRIFDDGITLSVTRRTLPDAIVAGVKAQMQCEQALAWYWHGPVDTAMRDDLTQVLDVTPDDALAADVCRLAATIATLCEARQVAVRLRRLDGAMCPRFHVDNLGVRFITTYAGPGTEWLPNAAAERRGLGAAHPDKPDIVRDASQIRRLAPGDLALMKGSGWAGHAGLGLVHRSPPGHRLILTIDPG